MEQAELEKVAKQSMYEISRTGLYRVNGETLAEIDVNIKKAVSIIAAQIKAALDAEATQKGKER